jgi:hypothetical protein
MLLAGVNTVAWGFAIREVGDPKPSIRFLTRLIFNEWFIIAMVSAFVASILSYIVLQRMGVLAGRFILATQMGSDNTNSILRTRRKAFFTGMDWE